MSDTEANTNVPKAEPAHVYMAVGYNDAGVVLQVQRAQGDEDVPIAHVIYHSRDAALNLMSIIAMKIEERWPSAPHAIRGAEGVETDETVVVFSAQGPESSLSGPTAFADTPASPYVWTGEGEAPCSWTAPDGTIVYRDYLAYAEESEL